MGIYDAAPGLLACAATAMCAAVLAWLAPPASGISLLPLAIGLGMLAGNTMPGATARATRGIALARGTLLRAGIALYGFRIAVDELSALGWTAPLLALLIVGSTLALAMLLGRALRLPRHAALLIGAGSAICGAAAVAAADGVLRAQSRHVATAVASVVIFGALGMYVLPALHAASGLAPQGFGLWVGLTVHELGQVVAAGATGGPAAETAALVQKMLRVLLLAPAVAVIALMELRGVAGGARAPLAPLFMWVFVLALALNAGGVLPAAIEHGFAWLAQALLAVGLAGLGFSTRLADVREAGLRVWALAALLWLYLLGVGYAAVRWLA